MWQPCFVEGGPPVAMDRGGGLGSLGVGSNSAFSTINSRTCGDTMERGYAPVRYHDQVPRRASPYSQYQVRGDGQGNAHTFWDSTRQKWHQTRTAAQKCLKEFAEKAGKYVVRSIANVALQVAIATGADFSQVQGCHQGGTPQLHGLRPESPPPREPRTPQQAPLDALRHSRPGDFPLLLGPSNRIPSAPVWDSSVWTRPSQSPSAQPSALNVEDVSPCGLRAPVPRRLNPYNNNSNYMTNGNYTTSLPSRAVPEPPGTRQPVLPLAPWRVSAEANNRSRLDSQSAYDSAAAPAERVFRRSTLTDEIVGPLDEVLRGYLGGVKSDVDALERTARDRFVATANADHSSEPGPPSLARRRLANPYPVIRPSLAVRRLKSEDNLKASWKMPAVASGAEDRGAPIPLDKGSGSTDSERLLSMVLGTQEEPDKEVIKTRKDYWRVQVEAIYRRRNPKKLEEVPALLEKHAGKEAILFRKVCQRYDLDPNKQYTDEAAWEDEDKDVKDDDDDDGAGIGLGRDAQDTTEKQGPSSIGSLFGGSSGSIFGSKADSGIFGATTSQESTCSVNIFTTATSGSNLLGGPVKDSSTCKPATNIFGTSTGSEDPGLKVTASNIFGSNTNESPNAVKSLFGSSPGNIFNKTPEVSTFPGDKKESDRLSDIFGKSNEGKSVLGPSSGVKSLGDGSNGKDSNSIFTLPGLFKDSVEEKDSPAVNSTAFGGTSSSSSLFSTSGGSKNIFETVSKGSDYPPDGPAAGLSSLFGNTSSSMPLVGSSTGSGLFGNSSDNSSGMSTGTSLFGNSPRSSSSLFGNPSSGSGGFSSGTSIFGNSSGSTTNLFGKSKSEEGLFGAVSATKGESTSNLATGLFSGFGSTTKSADSTSIFASGTPSTKDAPTFGSSTAEGEGSSGSSLSAINSLFPASTSGSSLFGMTSSTSSSSSLFGSLGVSMSSSSLFGTTPVTGSSSSLFSAGSSSNLFGTPGSTMSATSTKRELDGKELDGKEANDEPRKADADVLKQRKILRVKRSNRGSAPEAPPKKVQFGDAEVIVSSPEVPSKAPFAGLTSMPLTSLAPATPSIGSLFGGLSATMPSANEQPASSVSTLFGSQTGANPMVDSSSNAVPSADMKPPAPAGKETTSDSTDTAANTANSADVPSEEGPIHVKEDNFWKVAVEAIYRKRNPKKLGEVDSLLEKHKGKELVLYVKVCKRYDLNPKKFYTDPSAWEDEDKDVKDDDGDEGGEGGAPVGTTAPATGMNLFGNNNGSTPTGQSLFGSPTSGSALFSSPAGSSATGLFAGFTAGGSGSGLFGTPATGSLFGGSAGSGQAAASSGSTLGTSTVTSLFGGTGSGNIFGGASPSSNGTSTNVGFGLFNKPESNSSSSSVSALSSSGFMFGSNPSSGGSLFGGPAAPSAGSIFGAPPAGTSASSIFGSPGGGFSFGTTPSTGGVLFGTPPVGAGSMFGNQPTASGSFGMSMTPTPTGGSGDEPRRKRRAS